MKLGSIGPSRLGLGICTPCTVHQWCGACAAFHDLHSGGDVYTGRPTGRMLNPVHCSQPVLHTAVLRPPYYGNALKGAW
jgi:hypothetical protein